MDSYKANGVSDATFIRVDPPSGHDAFGVNNITFTNTTYPSEPAYKYADSDLNTAVAGIPGQNTDPPQAKLFVRHFIIRRGSGSEYYDPSYGVTTTGATNYSSNIGAWRRDTDLHWRNATGSGLMLIFTNSP